MWSPADLPCRMSTHTGDVRHSLASSSRFSVLLRRAAVALALSPALFLGSAVPADQPAAVQATPARASVELAATSATGSLALGAPRLNTQVGTTTTALNLRTGPSTGYSIITVLPAGTQGTVLGSSGGWYNIQTSRGTGWVSGSYFNVGGSAPAPTPSSGTGYTTAAVNLRTGPSTGYGVITVLPYGTQGNVLATSNGWYNVQTSRGTGWVSGSYFRLGSAPAPTAPSGSTVVSIARRYVGYPYVYGAAGPSAFDCSGFTQYVYSRAGITLGGRSAAAQFSYTRGTRISSYSALQPGDLVFFANTYKPGISHVGIYVGSGQMIHAGNSSTGVAYTSIYSSYYSSRFAGGIRP